MTENIIKMIKSKTKVTTVPEMWRYINHIWRSIKKRNLKFAIVKEHNKQETNLPKRTEKVRNKYCATSRGYKHRNSST